MTVAFRLTTGAAVRQHGDSSLTQPVLGYFLDGAGLPAPEEYHAVHISQNGFGVFIVNRLTLGQLLIEQRQADLTGTEMCIRDSLLCSQRLAMETAKTGSV